MMVASLPVNNSTSSLPMLQVNGKMIPASREDEPGTNKSTTGSGPGLLKSNSADRLIVRDTRKKSYLNQRWLHPEIKDQNRGSVRKSLGKLFDSDEDLAVGATIGKVTSKVGKFLGSRLGATKKSSGSFESLHDDEADAMLLLIESAQKSCDITQPTVDCNAASFSSLDMEDLTEKPTSQVGGSLQFNISLALSNHSNDNSGVSAKSLIEKLSGSCSESSDEEDSFALGDSFASIESSDLPECLRKRLKDHDESDDEDYEKQKRKKKAAGKKAPKASALPPRGERRESSRKQLSSSMHSTRSTRTKRGQRSSSKGPLRNRSSPGDCMSASHHVSSSKNSLSKSSSHDKLPQRRLERTTSERNVRERYQNREGMSRLLRKNSMATAQVRQRPGIERQASLSSMSAHGSLGRTKNPQSRPSVRRQDSLSSVSAHGSLGRNYSARSRPGLRRQDSGISVEDTSELTEKMKW